MKGYREKDTSEQCLECRGKRPRIYGKWLEQFDFFYVVSGIVDNSDIEKNQQVCSVITQKLSGGVDQI